MLGNHPSLILGAALVVLGGTYGGVATFTAGHVASHSTVDGVAIGGMSAPELRPPCSALWQGEQ